MFLLFDIGGTKTRIALSRDKKTFEEPHVIATPKTFEEGVAMLGELAGELAQGESIIGAVGGIAGPLNREKTMLVNAPNLSDWIGKPLQKTLQQRLNTLSVRLENDAALAGLGEAVAGAGKEYGVVAYLTIGTGVGGARITAGHIDENAMGFEPGHQYIDQSGGDLESLVSGSGLKKRFGKDPREIRDPAVWEELARLFAYGLHNTIVHWSPDIVVLGGSMILGDPAISFDRLTAHLKTILTIFPTPPPLVKAELGDRVALHGALVLLTSLFP